MAKVKWTKEQLNAILERGCNLLVAAAAGSGKTAVLVERIISKITDLNKPVDIDRLLVVTFTSAAATEMRERIGDAISKVLETNPDSKHLQRQLTLLNRATITTIHSFCLEVVRNNFHLIDLDPGFRIADQTESVLIKMEALEEIFEDKYEEDSISEEFLKLVECYGGSKDDQALQNIVLELFEFVQSHPWPGKWLEEKTERFNMEEGCDFGKTIWGRTIMSNVKVELEGLLDIMRRSIKIIQNTQELQSYLSTYNEDKENIEAILESGFESWDTLFKTFQSLDFGRLPRCGKDVDNEMQERVKAARNDVKGRMRKIRDDILVSESADILSDLRHLYPLIQCLAQLVLEFGEKYSEKKKDKGILDFNDLEHFCLDILIEDIDSIKPSNTAMEFREKFEEIFIDEYQDSNLVQEVILSTISRKDDEGNNMFMVGDVKQSIYRFRQARPELFLDKYNKYSFESDSKNRVIQLFKNFRSRREIIDAANFIFRQVMSENIGELDYSEKEALNYGALYEEEERVSTDAGREVEMHIIDLSDDTSDSSYQDEDEDGYEESRAVSEEKNEEELDRIQAEARIAGNRIKELVRGSSGQAALRIFDKGRGEYRDLHYRDIAILLRTTANWADVFAEELSKQGIPVYSDTGTGYFTAVEVQTITCLLQIVDNPMQDIPLLSVLRSPIGSFSEDEMVDIRMCDQKSSFYEAMLKLIETDDGETAYKACDFLKRLDVWREKARHMSTDELIWYLYSDTGYYGYAGAMPGGVQRQANLKILFERARLFEETSYRGLFNFINFINRLKSSRGDMGSAKILGEKENVVRIMSIHKSKGLEFPVVFVSGCGKRFNLQDLNKRILIHQELGFGPDFVDYEKRILYSTAAKEALKFKIKTETLSEEMRILYVAFTRAREKLILTGSVSNIDKCVYKWSGCANSNIKLGAYEMSRALNYLDWIGPAVLRHRDVQCLRQRVNIGESIQLLEDKSRWEVRIWSKGDVEGSTYDENVKSLERLERFEELKREDSSTGSKEINEEVKRRLDWEYSYKASTTVPAKVSVTELKRFFNTEFSGEYHPEMAYMQSLVTKPEFLQETKGLNAAEKGSALHFVMQHLCIDGDLDSEKIEQQIKKMVDKEMITEQQAGEVNINSIALFFESDLGLRMLKSQKVFREVPFNLKMKCDEIYSTVPDNMCRDDTILLQGIIDCYFEEDNDLILLDYKTDYVPAGNMDVIKKQYGVQIQYYSKALEKITGRKVKGKYIYLFWNGLVIEY